MDTASLVIGIIAAVTGFIPCIQIFAFIPAVVGLILGTVSFLKKRQTDEPSGMALAGIILNALPLIWMISIVVLASISGDASSISDMTIK